MLLQRFVANQSEARNRDPFRCFNEDLPRTNWTKLLESGSFPMLQRRFAANQLDQITGIRIFSDASTKICREPIGPNYCNPDLFRCFNEDLPRTNWTKLLESGSFPMLQRRFAANQLDQITLLQSIFFFWILLWALSLFSILVLMSNISNSLSQ